MTLVIAEAALAQERVELVRVGDAVIAVVHRPSKPDCVVALTSAAAAVVYANALTIALAMDAAASVNACTETVTRGGDNDEAK